MGQKEVNNENYCGVFEMRDLARFFSEVLKLPPLKKNASFSERLKGGWTKEQLMKYYSLSEEEYERLIVTIRNIKNGKKS